MTKKKWLAQCPFCNEEVETRGEKTSIGCFFEAEPIKAHHWLKHPEQSGTFKVKGWNAENKKENSTLTITFKTKAEHEQKEKERFTPVKYEATASKGKDTCAYCYRKATQGNPYPLSDKERQEIAQANIKEGRILSYPRKEPIGYNQYKINRIQFLTCWDCLKQQLLEKMSKCSEWEIKRLSTYQNAMNNVLSKEIFEPLAEENQEVKDKNNLGLTNTKSGILRECSYCHQNKGGIVNDYGDDKHDFYCVKTRNEENSHTHTHTHTTEKRGLQVHEIQQY